MVKLMFVISLFLNLILGAGIVHYSYGKDFWNDVKVKWHLSTPQPDTPIPDKYQEKISLFNIMPQRKHGIIFLGDSVIEGINWTEFYDNLNIKNRGIGGDWTAGVLSRLDEVLDLEPRKIFILLGGNDLYNKRARNTERDFENIVSNYEKILSNISHRLPQTKIYIISVIPVNHSWHYVTVSDEEIRALNAKLQLLSNKKGIKYIDLYSNLKTEDNELDPRYTGDGLHLNSEGYLAFKKVVDPYVK
jgi:lysophospholipase L1-like esterase